MSSFRVYLQLMRFPAVFTAMGDVILGFMLNHQRLDDAPSQLGLLLVSSSCLYLAGMVLNDVFDREVDARERPQRPIPSGRVSIRSAQVLGTILLAAGVGSAALVGLQSLLVAGGLAAAILLYDGFAKHTAMGPVVMGGCRFLNVILGASAQPRAFMVWGGSWNSTQIWIAAGLGIYIAGVTWFARQEAGQSQRKALLLALVVINAGLLLLLAWAFQTPLGRSHPKAGLSLAILILIINRQPVVAALGDPRPERVQGAVRSMLLSLIMLDAMLVFLQTEDPLPALVIVALLIPAMFLGRWIYVT